MLIRLDVIWKKLSRPLYHVHFTVIHTNSRHNDKFPSISLDMFGRSPLYIPVEGHTNVSSAVLKYYVLLWTAVCSMILIFQIYVPRHQFKHMPWNELEYDWIIILLWTNHLFHPTFHIVRCSESFVGKKPYTVDLGLAQIDTSPLPSTLHEVQIKTENYDALPSRYMGSYNQRVQ